VAPPANQLSFDAAELRNWRFIAQFQDVLKGVLKDQPLAASFADPERLLGVCEYLSLFLFGLFNPCVRTMRGLCQASRLERVQQEVCQRGVSLGSFSETQHLLDPVFLERVFGELSQAVPRHAQDARLGQWEWLARDGSLFAALPRMHWALYGAGAAGAANRAVRLHLSLNVLEDKPQVAALKPGKICERKVWRSQWQRGQAYVGDRYFGEDYKVFGELQALGSTYVIRLLEQAIVNGEQELPLLAEDRAAGVERQAWVTLGGQKRYRSVRLRLVWVRTREGHLLMLATNLSPEQLPAHLVWLLYKQRWKVELFFRWIKCILGCRHWLAESPNGTAIQIYLALIAALLLQLAIGRRPNKRMMELIQLHQLGIATAEELAQGLRREQDRLTRRPKV
jgi:Transposase DDE domain